MNGKKNRKHKCKKLWFPSAAFSTEKQCIISVVEMIPERGFPCLSEGSFRGQSLQWIRCPGSGRSTSGSSRACRLLCGPADSFFAAYAHLLQVAEFLFKPYLQDSAFFFPRCCDTSWWSALMTDTFTLRLSWCSLELRRGFTVLPGFSCLPWASLRLHAFLCCLCSKHSEIVIFQCCWKILLLFSAAIPLWFSSLSQDFGPCHKLQIQVENPSVPQVQKRIPALDSSV